MLLDELRCELTTLPEWAVVDIRIGNEELVIEAIAYERGCVQLRLAPLGSQHPVSARADARVGAQPTHGARVIEFPGRGGFRSLWLQSR